MTNTPPDPPRSPEELAAHLRTAVGALVRSTRPVDRLAAIPAAVLDLLDANGPMTTADLASSRGVRHQTMAATVKDLVAAGFLATTTDPGDARKKILTLTEDGKNALDADRRQRVGVLARALDESLSKDDQRVLEQALNLIDRITETVARSHHPGPDDSGPITGAW